LKVYIEFPDGHREMVEVDIDLCKMQKRGIECIAEQIARELADRYCTAYGCQDEERVYYAYLGWVLPHTIEALTQWYDEYVMSAGSRKKPLRVRRE